VIQLPVGTKIWIAAGVTELRRSFDELSAQVQNVLHEQPFFGHVFTASIRSSISHRARPRRRAPINWIDELLPWNLTSSQAETTKVA
jgi:transposase